jgi:hypothetical protein
MCSGCETLRVEMAVDPPVDPHYGCHLLIKGWAGAPLSRGERAYRLAHMPAAQSGQVSGRQNARFLVPQRKSVRFEAEKVS